MKEHKQIAIMRHCKMCSIETDRFGRKYERERKFISHVNDPHRFVCGCCGVFITLTDEEIKDVQLNSESRRKITDV